eukprot:m.78395 g.78395  ORF g.78395 m.78395 type:complete len:1251 (-) comp12532_c0_seq4:230-3982(-)
MGASLGSSVKWLDAHEELFQVRVRAHSTIHLQDYHVQRFMNACAKHDRSTVSDQVLTDTIKALYAMSPTTRDCYLPVVFDQLLELLPSSPNDDDSVSREVVRCLLFHVAEIHKNLPSTAMAPIVQSYVDHVVCNVECSSTGRRTVFTEIVAHFLQCLEDTDPQTIRRATLYAWFFLRLIAKTMAQYSNKNKKVPRTDRFSMKHYENLLRLVHRLGRFVAGQAKVEHQVAMQLNSAVAQFVLALFDFADRGRCDALVESYVSALKNPVADASATAEVISTVCRFEFIRQLCHYRYYLALNLPLPAQTMDEAVGVCDEAFKQKHFLAWVLLSNVQGAMNHRDISLRTTAIATLREAIVAHESDVHFQGDELQGRIAALYFPLVTMVLEHSHRLWNIAGGHSADSCFTLEETQDLLMCFVYVLKYFDEQLFVYFVKTISFDHRLFEMLLLVLKIFQYKGRHAIIAHRLDAPIKTHDALKLIESEYEAVSSAQTPTSAMRRPTIGSRSQSRISTFRDRSHSNSTAQLQMPKRLSRLATARGPSPNPPQSDDSNPGSRVFRLSSAMSLTGSHIGDELDTSVTLAAHLALESALVVLEKIENIIEGSYDEIVENDGSNRTTQYIMNVLLQLLKSHPCEELLHPLFAAITNFVHRFPEVFFNPASSYCQDLCLQLLVSCNATLPILTMLASSCLLFLMSENMNQLSQEIMISMSKFAGAERNSESEDILRESLQQLPRLAASQPPTPQFPLEVEDLTQRLLTVLVNTAKFQKFKDDPEMLVDLQYDIALSYSRSPLLRVTWLESIGKLHAKNGKWSEAANCSLHCAAIVAQVLNVQKNPFFRLDLRAFRGIAPNCAMEKLEGLAFDQATTLKAALFTERGFVKIIQTSVICLKKAQRFELVSPTYHLIIPYYEHTKQYKVLEAVYADILGSYKEIISSNESGRRIFGTYYRVRFFGEKFGELNQAEFIYKEPTITPLAAFTQRMRELYTLQLRGTDVDIITDSAPVDISSLTPSKAYIQITGVVPHVADRQPSAAVDPFEEHHNIDTFVFETPFTKSGKARSDKAEDQWQRKTVIKLVLGTSFPHLRTRLRTTTPHQVVELNPIQVAVEALNEKCERIAVLVQKGDLKLLSLVLQGIISPQVNTGPMVYAETFLKQDKGFSKAQVLALERSFESLLEQLTPALDMFERLAPQDQLPLVQSLRQKYEIMRAELFGMLPNLRRKQRKSMVWTSAPSAATTTTTAPTQDISVSFFDGITN